jgi:hypothetical protein
MLVHEGFTAPQHPVFVTLSFECESSFGRTLERRYWHFPEGTEYVYARLPSLP